MKISDLIKSLEKIKAKHGDLPIAFEVSDDDCCPIDKIKSKEVKRTWFHTIEIDSLEELLEFKQACGCNIVIEEVGNIPTLEIYDSYRE